MNKQEEQEPKIVLWMKVIFGIAAIIYGIYLYNN